MTPDGHVPALVVADPRLRPDVAAGEADLCAERNVQARRWIEGHLTALEIHLGRNRGADGIGVFANPGQQRKREAGQSAQPLVCLEHCDAGTDVHIRLPVQT